MQPGHLHGACVPPRPRPSKQPLTRAADDFSGRIWARTGCTFKGKPCATGDCGGGAVDCPQGSTGATPVTLAEFTLAGSGQDNYDVSSVDGVNLPISLVPSGGCPVGACETDLVAQGCPDPSLQVKDADGRVVGCNTACNADIHAGKDTSNSLSCCTGSHDTVRGWWADPVDR